MQGELFHRLTEPELREQKAQQWTLETELAEAMCEAE